MAKQNGSNSFASDSPSNQDQAAQPAPIAVAPNDTAGTLPAINTVDHPQAAEIARDTQAADGRPMRVPMTPVDPDVASRIGSYRGNPNDQQFVVRSKDRANGDQYLAKDGAQSPTVSDAKTANRFQSKAEAEQFIKMKGLGASHESIQASAPVS